MARQMLRSGGRTIAVLAATGFALAGWSAAPAAAQPDAADVGTEGMSENDLIRDIIHFVKIDRPEAAVVLMRELLGRSMTPEQFTLLIEDSGELSRFEEAMAQALRTRMTEPLAAELTSKYERGKLDRARNPDEVTRNIEMLSGGARARLLARARLIEAGEYAMPQLLNALLQRDRPALQAEVQRLLIDMGQQAVTPLCTALPELDEVRQELVLTVLGNLGYRTAAPYLHDVEANATSEAVRIAARRAITLLGLNDPGRDVADWYLSLANDYYNEAGSLTSFPREDHQLLWAYDDGLGLVATAIRTPVYHEAMAMRLAERSLSLRSDNPESLALWVAANYSRELDQPAGYNNPAYPDSRRAAEYFAVASGTDVTQRVLARALDDRDTPLAREALAAIERTAGATAMRQGPRGRRPLIEALTYPNRRVQIEAALALGASQPSETFDGAERIVPTLAEAVRDTETRFAAVLASDQERYQGLRRLVEAQGYEVLPFAANFDALDEPLAAIPGLDLVVTSLADETTERAIDAVAASRRFGATPVLSLMPTADYARLQRKYERRNGVMLRPSGLSEREFGAAASELVRVASGGPITGDEADLYAARALRVLRDLALTSSPAIDVRDGAQALTLALGSRTGALRDAVADVLGHLDDPRAQQALMQAALDADGSAQARLLQQTATSVKRFGGMLEPRQVSRVVALATTGSGAPATAAAALMGALNLPNDNVLPLILAD